MNIHEVHAQLKYSSSSVLPELAGGGGFLQGDQGHIMTPGFPGQEYPNGALYQVHKHTHKQIKLRCEL